MNFMIWGITKILDEHMEWFDHSPSSFSYTLTYSSVSLIFNVPSIFLGTFLLESFLLWQTVIASRIVMVSFHDEFSSVRSSHVVLTAFHSTTPALVLSCWSLRELSICLETRALDPYSLIEKLASRYVLPTLVVLTCINFTTLKLT